MTLAIRKLGSQGLAVSAIGLGCMGMNQSYGVADEAESIAVLHRAIELGCNFLDTAERYGPYTNEELLGRALVGKRHQVVLATKFGYDIPDRPIRPGEIIGMNSTPPRIRAAVEGSLRRLRTDHIDLLYQHRVDPAVAIEEVAGTVGELIREGKVRFFGLSEAGTANIKRAHEVCPVSALQSEYSLWERNLEHELIPLLRELGIGLVPYAPLGRGFLTGSAARAEEYSTGDIRRNDPRFQGTRFDANREALRVVLEMSAGMNATPGQIAIAWLLEKGRDIVPIPGTKRRTYLEENIAAASLALDSARMKALDEALGPGKISGPRYGEQMMARIDR